MCLFSVFIYAPLAHWTWHPDGFLHKLGVLDFAGGTVVHMSAGLAALAGAMTLGRRKTHAAGEAHDAGEHPVRHSRHRACSGSDGSASTPARRCRRPARRRWRLRRPTRRRRRRRWPGSSSTACAATNRRRSAPASAPSSASSRSRRRPATSASARASSSAPCASVVSNLMVHWKNSRRRSTTRSTCSRATASAAWSAC